MTALGADHPLVSAADYVITFNSRESQKGAIGSFYSTTCMNFILNCIDASVRVDETTFRRGGLARARVAS